MIYCGCWGVGSEFPWDALRLVITFLPHVKAFQITSSYSTPKGPLNRWVRNISRYNIHKTLNVCNSKPTFPMRKRSSMTWRLTQWVGVVLYSLKVPTGRYFILFQLQGPNRFVDNVFKVTLKHKNTKIWTIFEVFCDSGYSYMTIQRLPSAFSIFQFWAGWSV